MLALAGCTQNQSSAPVADPEPLAGDSQQKSPPGFSITEIPLHYIRLPKEPGPWPFQSRGIRFQRGFDPAAANISLVRPLGDAALDADGSLYLAFPQKDLVVGFRAPQFKTHYYGPQHQGGQGQLIKDPTGIRIYGERFYLNNDRNGKVMVYDLDLNFVDMYQLEVPSALVGPGDRFLLVSPNNPNSLVRANAGNRMEQQYLLNDDASVFGDGSRLVFHILDNWQLVAARRNGSRIYHLEPDAHHIRQMILDFSDVEGANQPGASVVVHAIRYTEGRYWLLFDLEIPGRATQNLLLVADEAGKVKYLWRTDFLADGLDLNQDTLLLFHRTSGAAETYRRK